MFMLLLAMQTFVYMYVFCDERVYSCRRHCHCLNHSQGAELRAALDKVEGSEGTVDDLK